MSRTSGIDAWRFRGGASSRWLTVAAAVLVAVASTDLAADADVVPTSAYVIVGLLAALSAQPVAVGTLAAIAALAAALHAAGDDMSVLRDAAHVAVVAIGGLLATVWARVLLDDRRSRFRARTLVDVAGLLEQDADADTTLVRVCQAVVASGVADGCAIAVRDGDRLTVFDETGDRRPVDVDDPDDPIADVLRTCEKRAVGRDVWIHPLPGRDGCHAALWLRASHDEDLADDLCGRVRVALESARLDREHRRVAATLRQSLVPRAVPTLPDLGIAARFLPADGGVAGDFYDVMVMGPHRCVLLMGDVCGKGADAAALTALARHTLRAAVLRGDGPRDAILLLNEAIRSAAPEQFCTVAVVDVDVSSSSRAATTIALGGHPPALVRDCRGETREAGRPGTLIGIFDDPQVHEVRDHLGPGEALVLYTDGASEARVAGREIGLVGLTAAIRAAEGVDAIAEAIVSAGGPDRQCDDDVAVLVVALRADGSPSVSENGGQPRNTSAAAQTSARSSSS